MRVRANSIRWPSIVAFCLVFGMPAHAATAYFTAVGTATSGAGSSGPVSVGITFVTLQDEVQITIHNYIVGASKDVQALSSVDFVLSGGQTTGLIMSQTGLVRTISSTGTWAAGDTAGGRPANFSDASYHGAWKVQAGGGLVNPLANSIDLTAFSGSSPSLTIFGASTGTSANCCYNAYGNPNNAVTKHNPYLATDGQDVVFLLSVAGVRANTTIGNVRAFFGTDRTAYLTGVNSVPEANTCSMVGAGFLALGLRWARRRRVNRKGPNA